MRIDRRSDTGPESLSTHRRILAVLLVAFAARVVAQLTQHLWPVGFLPSFDAFQSGVLPYPLLLISQVAILAVGILAWIRLGRAGPPWPPAIRVGLSLVGAVYLITMLFRLWLGFTDTYDGTWFDEPIPTVFHLALATALAVIVHAEWSRLHWPSTVSPVSPASAWSGPTWPDQASGPTADMVAVILYPAVIGSAIATFVVLDRFGMALPLAAYATVAVATAAILAAEWRWPARASWRPAPTNLVNDGLFLVAIQIALPAAVGIGLTVALQALADEAGLTFDGIWPHHWPVPVQMVLMLLLGDGARYWLHRASHQPNFLWRLHAVHHSPDRLYSLNVARFHPFDKALQYVFDTLPFVVLAVAEPVLLSYFVFYAVNGFFQHSNCHIRLGPLNWVVSGPELHRWHHSRVIGESDQNFGNNLIIWDIIFGTRFLPDDRVVGELGLLNRSYPTSFVDQMTSVFVPGLDKQPVHEAEPSE